MINEGFGMKKIRVLVVCLMFLISLSASVNAGTTDKVVPFIKFVEFELKPDINNRGVITGKIRNPWNRGYDNIQVQAIIYDKNNLVIEIGTTYPMGVLEPGETQEFKIHLNHLIEHIDNYKIFPLTTSLNAPHCRYWRN